MGLRRRVTQKVNAIYFVYQLDLGHGTLQDLEMTLQNALLIIS